MFSLAWVYLRIPQVELESIGGEQEVWVSLLDLLPSQTGYGQMVEDGDRDTDTYKFLFLARNIHILKSGDS